MFCNLYFQSRRFRNFNRAEWKGRVRQATASRLRTQIRGLYDGAALAPWFECAIRRSLRPETAYVFLQRVSLPVTERDFLLSKLFQFLYVPLKIQNQLDKPGALPLRRKLEHWLDGLSKRATLQLHRFDWLRFVRDSMTLDRAVLLGSLDRYLPLTKERSPRTPAMGRRGPPPDLESYKAVTRAVRETGEDWAVGGNLLKVAGLLDDREVMAPESWASLEPPATSWSAAVETHRKRVVKIIRYRIEAWKQMRRRERAIRKGRLPKPRG
jgi:hypothetical protein